MKASTQKEVPVLKYQNDKGFMLSFKRPASIPQHKGTPK